MSSAPTARLPCDIDGQAAHEEWTMGAPVVHFEVMSPNAGRLHAFFGQLFGWEIDANNPMRYGTVARADNLSADGTGIAGGIGQCPPGYEGHLTFYVEVPDIEASLQQAEALGGTRLMGPDKVMEGVTIGQFLDPDGHVVGLLEAG